MTRFQTKNRSVLGKGLPGRQQGAVLVFSLLLLLVMTVLGVASVGNSVLEERMSGNFYQSTAALQAAEVALRVAEGWLDTEARPKGRDIALGWFKKTSAKKGLYSIHETVDPVSKIVLVDKNYPCMDQAATPPATKAGCIFDPTDEDHWATGTDQLPKGAVALGSNDLGTGDLAAMDSKIVNQQPRFIIEYIGRAGEYVGNIAIGSQPTPDIRKYAFRVTAIGWGRDASARAVLQSHFLVPL